MKHSMIYITILLMLLLFPQSEAYLTETTVRVTNDLGQGRNLITHCKSRDDDIGKHVLQYKEYFQWGFRANIWGSTVFSCDMRWANATGSFKVYEQVRDEELCGSQCYWYIRPIGACLHSDVTLRDYCIDWPK